MIWYIRFLQGFWVNSIYFIKLTTGFDSHKVAKRRPAGTIMIGFCETYQKVYYVVHNVQYPQADLGAGVGT